ncbi:hypothetical protein PF010_g18662 [Phytophthora fragariae]|uniref:Uncharacterized protein n=1 Tax=Phytophthora fragariae TaxID=53985 RepID=A0A6G0KJH6_9STRA|nr:hypothetical protein PF010_g18662 [Phytophthora fragariae]
MARRILTPLKDGDLERLWSSLKSSARTIHNAITSVRPAAEWGMGSVQKVYSRARNGYPKFGYGYPKFGYGYPICLTGGPGDPAVEEQHLSQELLPSIIVVIG